MAIFTLFRMLVMHSNFLNLIHSVSFVLTKLLGFQLLKLPTKLHLFYSIGSSMVYIITTVVVIDSIMAT